MNRSNVFAGLIGSVLISVVPLGGQEAPTANGDAELSRMVVLDIEYWHSEDAIRSKITAENSSKQPHELLSGSYAEDGQVKPVPTGAGHEPLSIEKFKRVKLNGVNVFWTATPSRFKPSPSDSSRYVVEYLTASETVVRVDAIGSSAQSIGDIDLNREIYIHAYIPTVEDGIGYRLYDKTNGALLGEEHFGKMKREPRITVAGDLLHGLKINSDMDLTTLSVEWSFDNGSTWPGKRGANGGRGGSFGPVSQELIKNYDNYIIEIRASIGLNVFRNRFVYDQGVFKQLSGPFPAIAPYPLTN